MEAAPLTPGTPPALEQVLTPEVSTRARAVAGAMRSDGAAVAARRLLRIC